MNDILNIAAVPLVAIVGSAMSAGFGAAFGAFGSKKSAGCGPYGILSARRHPPLVAPCWVRQEASNQHCLVALI